MLNYIGYHYLQTWNGFETLNTFTFHVEKYIINFFLNVYIKKNKNHESKYNAQTIYI
jgi:hypothetical protein